MSIVFIIKPEVAGTTTMTYCLSSRDPTEKYSISHSYVFMSYLEDAGIRHSGDLHWASGLALALQPDAKCICDGRASSHKGLHDSQPQVSFTSDEPVLPSTPVVRRYHLGRHTPILPTAEVPTDGESDSDTHLTPIVSLDSNPSRPSVIRRNSDSSSSSAAFRHVPPRFVVMGSFIPTLCFMDVVVL